MSHHSTPQLYNKRTPGSMNDGANNIGMGKPPGVNGSNLPQQQQQQQQQHSRPVMDSSRCISDTQAANAKQLLNAYIYDFLIKSRLPQTAKIFVNEAEIPSTPSSKSHQNSSKNSPQINSSNNNSSSNSPQTPNQIYRENNIPLCNVAMDAPQGFLFEWWQVFWDVFQAKSGATSKMPNSNNPNMALQYYQLQLLKQRQQQEMQGLNVQNPGMPLGAAPNGGHTMNNGAGGQFQSQQTPHPQLMQQQIPPHVLQQQLQQQQQQQQQSNQPGQQQPGQPQPQVIPGGQGQQIPGAQGQGQNIHMPPNQALDSQQQQRLMMQMMMKQQQQQQQQQIPISGNPLEPQQQQMINNMGPNNAMNLQQQLFLSQQHQQHQQSQNRIQQHAQTQMNNLRQQAAVAAQQQQAQVQSQQQTQGSNHHSPANGQRLSQMTPQAQNAPNPMNGLQQFPQQQQLMNGPNSQAPTPFPHGQPSQAHLMRMNSVSGKSGASNLGSPVMVNNNTNTNTNTNNNNSNNNNNNGNNASTLMKNVPNGNRNMNALQDYQMQLMLLEKQNKKRLDIARNNGGDMAGMPPPNQQQQPQPQGQTQSQRQQLQNQSQPVNAANSVGSIGNGQKESPATATSSPVINNKPSPSGSGGKKKKDPPGKRGRKPSTSGAANSTPGNNTAANTPSLLKKEYNAPLTPASESQNDLKRKRKSNAGPDSPKKQNTAKPAVAKKEKPVKEETAKSGDDKKEENSVPPPSVSNFQDPMAAPEQIFSVDMLGSSAGDTHNYFGTATQPSHGALDDIDFEFNQFLDGNGDSALHDGIGGFNWGNVDAIENGD